MADRQSTGVRETLKSLCSDQRLNALARSSGFVVRARPVSYTVISGALNPHTGKSGLSAAIGAVDRWKRGTN